MRSSEIIARSKGIEPVGVPAESPGVCALCGTEIKIGDLHSPLSLEKSFMDDIYMAARGSRYVCGWCVPHMSAIALRSNGYMVFSLEEERPFHKWADIAYSLENPPKPPFVMVHANAKNQHMAWRAPVNLSTEMFYVRFGLYDLKIRRKFLLQAVKDCILLGTAAEEAKNKSDLEKGKKPAAAKTNRKTLPHPFISLSPDLKDNALTHARLKPAVLEMAETNPEYQEAVNRILNLTLGETWGLRHLLTPGAGQSTENED